MWGSRGGGGVGGGVVGVGARACTCVSEDGNIYGLWLVGVEVARVRDERDWYS